MPKELFVTIPVKHPDPFAVKFSIKNAIFDRVQKEDARKYAEEERPLLLYQQIDPSKMSPAAFYAFVRGMIP